jgi:hypothetical protein
VKANSKLAIIVKAAEAASKRCLSRMIARFLLILCTQDAPPLARHAQVKLHPDPAGQRKPGNASSSCVHSGVWSCFALAPDGSIQKG